MKDNRKQIPNNDDHMCFGCSPVNPSGLQMKFFTDETTVFSRITIPEHLCGWSNLVHGGVLSTILDEIMGWAAIYLLKRFILTKSITVEFLKPVYMGGVLEAESKLLEVEGKHQATMEGVIFDAEGDVCARATADFAVFKPAVAKRLGIADERQLEWFSSICDQ
jgi:uncharacterized protein (TIGR00369 family)